MSCDSCPGKDLSCVNCSHWIGHKRAREQLIEQATEKWANNIAEVVKKGIEDACKKKINQGERK